MKLKLLQAAMLAIICATAQAQVNSGSNGSDGAFNPTTNTVINMADHPTGIYQYTSVNIPTNVTVTFIPNANNSPVTWLVQGSCFISGTVDVSGQNGNVSLGGIGGVGGFQGGFGGSAASSGQGPGGGIYDTNYAGNASYGSAGSVGRYGDLPGLTYGNSFVIPLIGGSGGGGSVNGWSGASGAGGGGGAILIACSGTLAIGGLITANGGSASSAIQYNQPPNMAYYGGGGSGGAVRLVVSKITGIGRITTSGGNGGNNDGYGFGGLGRVRFDTYQNNFGGQVNGVFSIGSQFIIIPTSGQLPQLTVTSVGGVPVSASPTGVLTTPDAILSALQGNPIQIVVNCANLPLNTPITVSVKPANGAAVSATGLNNSGTLASSTATISIVIPRGGGLIYATAATAN